MTHNETIVAQATPAGRGGVAIVRVSGHLCRDVCEAIVGKLTKPRYAEYLPFYDDQKQVIDYGLCLFFPSPNSFTGEDVLELHGHGGPMVVDLLIKRILQLGVRLAKPGEFSLRAFLHDKIDLTQAEAIADLIDSSSIAAARSALRSLAGEFSRQIQGMQQEMISLRMYVEAAIDFPEEEVDFLSDNNLKQRLNHIVEQLRSILQQAEQGNLLRDGMTVVIAGLPNAGKSSLLNQLSGEDTAIVTDIAGTTRDVIKTQIAINGLPIHIVDTAGLRDSDDPVEQQGVSRTKEQVSKADMLLLVIDQARPADLKHLQNEIATLIPEQIVSTIIVNKIDLSQELPRIELNEDQSRIYLSAKTGQGVDLLKQHLLDVVGYSSQTEQSGFTARRRHIDALNRSLNDLIQAQQQFAASHAGELLAEDLRQAHQQLAEITGEYTSDDLLGEIFANFCIGK